MSEYIRSVANFETSDHLEACADSTYNHPFVPSYKGHSQDNKVCLFQDHPLLYCVHTDNDQCDGRTGCMRRILRISAFARNCSRARERTDRINCCIPIIDGLSKKAFETA